MLELTDDILPVWVDRDVELDDREREAVHATFIDDEGADLLSDLHTAAHDAASALKFVREWSQKLSDKEVEAAEEKAKKLDW